MKAILLKRSRLLDKELYYSMQIKRHWYSRYEYECGFSGETVEDIVRQAKKYLDKMNNKYYPEVIQL